MEQHSCWQKLVSRVKTLLPGKEKIKPVCQKVLKKGLPYVLVAVFASAMTFAAFAAREDLSILGAGGKKQSLKESKQELEQTLLEAEELIEQLLVSNENMQALLEQAQLEERELTNIINNLQDAYNAQNQKWVLPMKYTMCTSYYGLRKHPVEGESKFHYGVDLAAPQGTPIVASRGGRVTIASYEADGAGYYVEIDHLDGYTSRYLHMNGYIVTTGQIVLPGQVIGYCGATGVATGVHLHFSIYKDGKTVDPADYIEI